MGEAAQSIGQNALLLRRKNIDIAIGKNGHRKNMDSGGKHGYDLVLQGNLQDPGALPYPAQGISLQALWFSTLYYIQGEMEGRLLVTAGQILPAGARCPSLHR